MDTLNDAIRRSLCTRVVMQRFSPIFVLSIAVATQLAVAAGLAQIPQKMSSGTASDHTGAIPSLTFNAVCDAVEEPVSSRGQYQYSTATGTDNTAAIASAVAALDQSSVRNNPAGAETEAELHTSPQKTMRLPSGCGLLVQTWPTMPDGTLLDCNHSSIFVSARTGDGPVWRNHNGGNTFGSDNNTERDCRIVYVGPQNASTGMGSAMLTGSHNRMENVSAYGFKIGVGIIGQDNGRFTDIQAGHGTIGVACVAGSWSVPAVISQTDFQTIDTFAQGVFSRDNEIGMVLDGCSTTKFDGGTLSFNHVADLIVGAIDFGFIDAFSLADTSQAICPASSNLPILVTDASASRAAKGYITTDEAGTPTAAWQTDGGRGHVQNTVSATVPGCTVPPRITPHVTSMAGILPFSGASTHSSAKDELYDFNLENESNDANGKMNRPSTGFQVILGPTANDIRLHRFVSGNSGGQNYAHFWINDGGQNNTVIDPLLPNITDPVTGFACQLMETNTTTKMDLGREAGIPDNQVCGPTGIPDHSYNVAMFGWKINMLRIHGYSMLGSGAGNVNDEPAFEADEPGDTQERVKVTPSGDAYYSDGSAAADVRTGRFESTPMGVGAWGLKVGVLASMPIFLGSNEGAPLFSFTFAANSGLVWTGPAFSLSSVGIPKQSVCNATWSWSGNGTDVSGWLYNAVAICNDGQGHGVQTYQSFGYTLGKERFVKQ